jgi:hypothetical protein
MTELTHSDAALLHELHLTWGGWYVIGTPSNGNWRAYRRGNPDQLIGAETGHELRELIATDAEKQDAETIKVLSADRCGNCGFSHDEHENDRCPGSGESRWHSLLVIGAFSAFVVLVWVALFIAYTHT